MTKIAVPPSFILVRADDFAALLAAQAASRPPEAASAPDPQSAGATMVGLGEAIGLLAARLHGIDSPGPSGDVPATAVIAALAIIACTTLAQLLPADRGARLLEDLGLAAAQEGTQ